MSDIPQTSPKSPRKRQESTTAWQWKLLPWMILLPTVLIGVFILQATIRMKNFETFVYQQQRSILENALPQPSDTMYKNNLAYQRLYVLARMEEYTVNKRYSQAGIITMSTIYTKYLGFFTGMILAIVGSVFIIGKLREESSEGEGEFKDLVKFRFISTSPGIIFALLGTVLMSISIINKGEVGVDDMPLYLNASNFGNIQPVTAGVDSMRISRIPNRISPADAASSHP